MTDPGPQREPVKINLGRASILAYLLTILLLGLFVWGGIYAAIDAGDTGTRVVGIVIACVAGLPGLLFLLDARAFFTPSFVVFSDEGVQYSRGAASATVPWSEIAAVGIGFEQPPNVPRIPTSITDAVSGFLSAKALEAMGVKDIRKVALEIYPVDPAAMARHKVLARLRREYESPRVDLPPVRWRLPLPPIFGIAKAVENGAAGFGGPKWLGWFLRPWTGGLFGAGKRPVPKLPPPPA